MSVRRERSSAPKYSALMGRERSEGLTEETDSMVGDAEITVQSVLKGSTCFSSCVLKRTRDRVSVEENIPKIRSRNEREFF